MVMLGRNALVILVLLCVITVNAQVQNCITSPQPVTIRNDTARSALVCGQIGGGLWLQANIGASVEWTFPGITQLNYLRVLASGNTSFLGNMTNMTVTFPDLTTVIQYLDIDAEYYARLTLVLPRLEKVFALAGFNSLDILANAGAIIDYVSIGGSSVNGLSISALTQFRSIMTVPFPTSLINLIELPRVAFLQSLTFVPQNRFDSLLINDGVVNASFPVLLITIGPVICGFLESGLEVMTTFVLARVNLMTSMAYTLGGIRNFIVNPPRTGAVAMVVTGEFRIDFGAGNVISIYDTLYLGAVSSIGTLTLFMRGTVGTLSINTGGQSPLSVTGNVQANANSINTVVKNFTVENLVYANLISFVIAAGTFQNAQFNTPNRCYGLVVGSTVTLSAPSSGSYLTAPFYLYGLERVRGALSIQALGPHGGAIIDTGGAQCGSGLFLDGNIDFQTTGASGFFTNTINITNVNKISGTIIVSCSSPLYKGISISPRPGLTIQIVNSLRVTSVNSAVLGPVRIGPISECRDVTIQVQNSAVMQLTELLTRAGDLVPVRGFVSVVVDASATLTNLTLSNIQQVGGLMYIQCTNGGIINFMALLGPFGGTWDILQTFTLTTTAPASLRTLLITNLQTIGGNAVITGSAQILDMQITAPVTSGLQIFGDLTISSTGLFRGITIGPLALVTGNLTLGTNLDLITINPANGPLLTIGGSLNFGVIGAVDGVAGAVTINNLVSVFSVFLYHNTNLNANAGEISIFGSVTDMLVVQSFFELNNVNQKAVRRISVTNLMRIGGLASVYRNPVVGAVTVFGPVLINGRTLNRIGIRTFDNITLNANDASCLNGCRGRGYETLTTTNCDQLAASACTCFPGNGGNFCADTCPANDVSCPCRCSVWGSWFVVQDTAQQRNRNCSVPGCVTVDLRGTVVCAVTVQYEKSPPTATSHRVCSSTTVCAAVGVEYELAPPTATSDRVCRAVGNCTATQYQTALPTATTNRQCATLTLCVLRVTVEAVKPTLTSDRVCVPCQGLECNCKSCASNEYVVTQCVQPPAQDTVCKTCDICPVNTYQTRACGGGYNVSCAPVTICRAGFEFVLIPPTLTSNAVCKTFTDCSAGYFEFAANTSSSDRVCNVLSQCANVDGKYELQVPTKTTDRVCGFITSCSAAEYRSVAPSASADATCAALSVCLPGQFVSVNATLTTDQRCSNCTLGQSYSDVPNLKACLRVAPCQPGSSYTGAPATLTSNVGCTACGPLEFQDLANQPSCKTATVCNTSIEYRVLANTAIADTLCAPLSVCELGDRYQSRPATLTSDRICVLVTQCVPNIQYQFKDCTLTSNRICKAYSRNCIYYTAEWQAFPGNETADRVCLPLTLCAGYEYEAMFPVPERDRVCKPYTFCQLNETEIFPPTRTTDRVCIAKPATTTPPTTPTTTSTTTTTTTSTAVVTRKSSTIKSGTKSTAALPSPPSTPSPPSPPSPPGPTDLVPTSQSSSGEKSSSSQALPSNTIYAIIGGGVAALFILVCMVVLIVACRRSDARDTRPSVAPNSGGSELEKTLAEALLRTTATYHNPIFTNPVYNQHSIDGLSTGYDGNMPRNSYAMSIDAFQHQHRPSAATMMPYQSPHQPPQPQPQPQLQQLQIMPPPINSPDVSQNASQAPLALPAPPGDQPQQPQQQQPQQQQPQQQYVQSPQPQYVQPQQYVQSPQPQYVQPQQYVQSPQPQYIQVAPPPQQQYPQQQYQQVFPSPQPQYQSPPPRQQMQSMPRNSQSMMGGMNPMMMGGMNPMMMGGMNPMMMGGMNPLMMGPFGGGFGMGSPYFPVFGGNNFGYLDDDAEEESYDIGEILEPEMAAPVVMAEKAAPVVKTEAARAGPPTTGYIQTGGDSDDD